ncbi:MAG: HNH endonuclease [Deltaproteobacteria bacterium RIFCSPLOWO2_12_FULL_40_28]|nr:MAG: HNH endonuclease [Deltaproteobacteria bacterium RIFCSPHIGHO2_02_FULL_40_28]OGQ20392.1 MAG: HNH endonuclease [Deltaproteobacteria bacterium RIFCSPHIGHO2_12_FULL_40_32]OGQ41361.1 MAG: HNH endonuclease [Deltaproteobacteria bacterium RIFCSPLOWO2_02_FULL_40_36]OGQ55000.1 MAG: HNH endonuclease [Deltaproteobacteria bacterium RIFCSPLOWO2_12_FULL_40_28]
MSQDNKKSNHLQKDLVVEFFRKNQKRDIKHPEVVDWVVATYRKRTGNVFRDPDRAIRHLAQSGFLIKIAKGIYRYDPEKVNQRELYDFTSAQKKEILERDGFKCVVCGKGLKDGIDLHVDHIKPKDFGGEATIVNGQVLCSQHNFIKKNFKQTETGKKMFIRLYELAKSEKNEELMRFCADLLGTYQKYNINGHIVWKK